jgi:tyrosine-protein phosphatase SIW14
MFRKAFLTLLATVLLTGCNNNSVLNTPQAEEPVSTAAVSGPQVTTMNFAQVNPNIFRGGVPDEKDMLALKNVFRVKTVISFRGMGTQYDENKQVSEEKAISDSFQLKFFNLPVPFDRPVPDKMIRDFFDIVDNPRNWPVYVHCTHGRDRTGTMVALYRIEHDGISGQQALQEMKSFGFNPADYPIFTKQVLNYRPLKSAF